MIEGLEALYMREVKRIYRSIYMWIMIVSQPVILPHYKLHCIHPPWRAICVNAFRWNVFLNELNTR